MLCIILCLLCLYYVCYVCICGWPCKQKEKKFFRDILGQTIKFELISSNLYTYKNIFLFLFLAPFLRSFTLSGFSFQSKDLIVSPKIFVSLTILFTLTSEFVLLSACDYVRRKKKACVCVCKTVHLKTVQHEKIII